MGPIVCPETPVRNYHYSLRNSPVELTSQRKVYLPLPRIWPLFVYRPFRSLPTDESIVWPLTHAWRYYTVQVTRQQERGSRAVFEPQLKNWNPNCLLAVIIIIIIIITVILSSLVTGLFFLVLLLSQRWSPPLRLQASHCSTFCVMCDVPMIAVLCSESIEYFPGTASRIFLKLLVTMPVAPVITGITVHFKFHIRCISIHKPLYYYYYYYYYYYHHHHHHPLLSQAFSSWYFSWTSGDPHRSRFKLHTAVLSVLCVMFQV